MASKGQQPRECGAVGATTLSTHLPQLEGNRIYGCSRACGVQGPLGNMAGMDQNRPSEQNWTKMCCGGAMAISFTLRRKLQGAAGV